MGFRCLEARDAKYVSGTSMLTRLFTTKVCDIYVPAFALPPGGVYGCLHVTIISNDFTHIRSSLIPAFIQLHIVGLIFVDHYIHHARGACLAVKSVKHADTSTCVCTASNAMSGALAVVFVTYSVGFSIIHFAVGNICLLSRVHSEEALLYAL